MFQRAYRFAVGDRHRDKGNKVWWVNDEEKTVKLQSGMHKEGSGEFFWPTLLRWM